MKKQNDRERWVLTTNFLISCFGLINMFSINNRIVNGMCFGFIFGFCLSRIIELE